MSKHTPGPWRIGSKNKKNQFFVIYAKDLTSKTDREVQVVSINYGSHPIKSQLDTTEANAKLIAAAPELLREMQRYLPILEALEQDVNLWDFFTQGTGIATLNGYRNAIKKATE